MCFCPSSVCLPKQEELGCWRKAFKVMEHTWEGEERPWTCCFRQRWWENMSGGTRSNRILKHHVERLWLKGCFPRAFIIINGWLKCVKHFVWLVQEWMLRFVEKSHLHIEFSNQLHQCELPATKSLVLCIGMGSVSFSKSYTIFSSQI